MREKNDKRPGKAEHHNLPAKKGSKGDASGVPTSSGGSRQGNIGHQGNTNTDNDNR